MYNNKGESKMDKTILVVEIVALKNLNEDENITYELFNGFGQFEVDTIEKVKDKKEVDNEITF
jgi:hypothetical protein